MQSKPVKRIQESERESMRRISTIRNNPIAVMMSETERKEENSEGVYTGGGRDVNKNNTSLNGILAHVQPPGFFFQFHLVARL